jgi:hypothetical protein
VSKRGDHLFSHWRPKQLEPDCAELTSSIYVSIGCKSSGQPVVDHFNCEHDDYNAEDSGVFTQVINQVIN